MLQKGAFVTGAKTDCSDRVVLSINADVVELLVTGARVEVIAVDVEELATVANRVVELVVISGDRVVACEDEHHVD